MTRELIIPNLHVILVHYPIGLFMTGLLVEIGAIFWRRHSFRAAGRWMIFLGALSMIPTTMSGIYALYDVAMINNPEVRDTWAAKLAASPLTAAQWGELFWHTWLMSISTAIVVLAVVGYVAMSDRLRAKLYLPTLGLLILGAGMMSAGAWFAGEAIYKLAVGVEGPEITTTRPAEVPATQQALSIIDKINTALPPEQPHMIMAGLGVAVALAAVGLSIRKITSDVPPPRLDEADALVQSLNPPPPPAPVLPGRFFMTAMVVFILTALGGWYILGSESGTFLPKELWKMVVTREAAEQALTRRLAHVIAASSLIGLPLIMAGLSRWAPRQKILLALCTLLLIGVIAAQVWIGVLLLFDGTSGTILHFNG